MVEQKNSHPLHFPLHLLCSGEATQVTSPIFFSSFTHWAPDAFDTPLTLSLLCCLPFYALQMLGYSWTSLQPAPVQHVFASAACFCFRQSLRHCPCHLQPNNIIVFSLYTSQGMSFGFRAIGSMASSWFWPSEAKIAVKTHLFLLGVTCSHIQEKTQKVIQSCFGWCTLHFQPCTQFRQN